MARTVGLNSNGRLHSPLSICFVLLCLSNITFAEETSKEPWKYDAALLRPFWHGEQIEGESVLFLKGDPEGNTGTASVLFPIQKILAVKSSSGEIVYEEGRDYVWKVGSREISIPAGSRIPIHHPDELRRPAGSQKYRLTHRDGNGEILFGARLEYAEMQTCITYQHAPGLWKSAVPVYDSKALPKTVSKLTSKQPVSIVVLGDSISAGANSSELGKAPPYQPAYPELLQIHLENRFGTEVKLKNLSVGGKATDWGITQVENVLKEKPDLVILAFGMNDSAGRSTEDYQAKTKQTIDLIREQQPETEFILVASMLGNRGWTTLKHERFPEYRDALQELCEPGIALADVTAIWTEFLKLKQDWDQTGNGVNHPNDFGHRVYAQVIATLLDPGK
ncbi:SGNH/GDSL hydrolase family protein [Thalassoglobus polymorphus]|uniref:GDSL-like Lipase/Acylhydrolase n=1 Tax=Thalassoglobus polymorphus TaxID=2527994 RepID=A0A517QLU3_9PLAN|nr:SGNH/GDSL hydrolase family protein [Thalassoglobus polymorphus]QDT32605.1 GDSL-like Lipase/Acylhydrolase [Thalassoglobus polymorphus]